MRRPYNIERRGICVPAARRIGQCLGYRLRNSHVKRFADAFEALAIARFEFVGEEGMTRPWRKLAHACNDVLHPIARDACEHANVRF